MQVTGEDIENIQMKTNLKDLKNRYYEYDLEFD